MFKRLIILLCFLAYSLTLVHSFVPHHHHDESISKHHHHHDKSNGNHHRDFKHHDQDESKTVSHAFADAIHLPGSEFALHAQSPDTVQRLFFVSEIGFGPIASLLALQLKPPDFNYDYRPTFYSTASYSLFLLRAPPLA